MGHGRYSYSDRSARATTMGYTTKSSHEIFRERSLNSEMNPHGVTLRESRDLDEHPNSLAIVLALDETGSMGSIPHFLVQEGLPKLITSIIAKGIADPQLLFLGIGDHEYDRAPLQVGQFESSDELLDKWLTSVYLEGGGGGNNGESYHLAWYFAGHHTAIDCLEKRNQKGFLFTVGDEPVLPDLPSRALSSIMGGQTSNFSSVELLNKAQEMYHVYHLHLRQGDNGNREEVMSGWRQLIGDNLIIIEHKEDVSSTIADIVTGNTSDDFITANEFTAEAVEAIDAITAPLVDL